MHNNCINKLINLKGVKVKNIKNYDEQVEIFIQTEVSPHICPQCGEETTKIHDYRMQKIKDISIQHKPTYLFLNKRRYVCKTCGKRFYESLDFLPKFYRMTSRLSSYIINSLRDNVSMKYIASKSNVSESTIGNRLDLIEYSKPQQLPEVLSIDEFKGNTNNTKYQCILVDAKNHKVIDILEDRKQSILSSYFRSFKDRSSVKYFVCDMWKPYVDLAKVYFKDAMIIIDKFHFIRHHTWAFEAVRKREQNRLGKHAKKLFRKCRKLLWGNEEKFTDDDKVQLNAILGHSDDLRQAFHLKKCFKEFCESENYETAKTNLSNFILIAQSSKISEYLKLANTLSNWADEILNSFKAPYTNGITEGFNNKIKVLKRVAFGFRNFKRFRNRIIHCCA